MKKVFLLSYFFMIQFVLLTNGQPSKEYLFFTKKADSLCKIEEYSDAAINYSLAFKSFNWKAYPEERYNAVCCWALAKNKDSAFFHLLLLITKDQYDNFEQIEKESVFSEMRHDKRWKTIRKIINKTESNYNKPIKKTLDSLFIEDQRYRKMLDSVEKNFGSQSIENANLWKIIKQKDSSNLVVLRKIITKYGWLGVDKVGQNGNTAFFLIIQHSNLKTQEEFVPIMKKAVNHGQAQGSDFALLIDRVEMRNGRKQIYGSQVQCMSDGECTIYPIEDEKNVNKRRADVGLGKLEDYMNYFGIDYHIPND